MLPASPTTSRLGATYSHNQSAMWYSTKFFGDTTPLLPLIVVVLVKVVIGGIITYRVPSKSFLLKPALQLSFM